MPPLPIKVKNPTPDIECSEVIIDVSLTVIICEKTSLRRVFICPRYHVYVELLCVDVDVLLLIPRLVIISVSL